MSDPRCKYCDHLNHKHVPRVVCEQSLCSCMTHGYINIGLPQDSEWKNEQCMMCLKQIPHNHAVCFDCAGKPGLEPTHLHTLSCFQCNVTHEHGKSNHEHTCEECIQIHRDGYQNGYKHGLTIRQEEIDKLTAHRDRLLDKMSEYEG